MRMVCRCRNTNLISLTLSTAIDHRHIAVPHGCYNSHGDDVGNALPYSSLSNHRDGFGNDILWDMWNCTAVRDPSVAINILARNEPVTNL